MGQKVSTRNPQGFKGSQTVAAESQLSLGMIFHMSGGKRDTEDLEAALLIAAEGENLEWGEIDFFPDHNQAYFSVKFFNDDVEIINSESVDDHMVMIGKKVYSIKTVRAKLMRIEERLNKEDIPGVERAEHLCELRSTYPA